MAPSLLTTGPLLSSIVPYSPKTPANQLLETSNNEEINIQVKVNQIIPFKVKKNDQIRKIKQMFYSKDGISESLLDIVCAKQKLENDKTLADYNLDQNSLLKLTVHDKDEFTRSLHVKIPSNGQIVDVHARVNDTIDLVKSLVVARTLGTIKSDEFDLFFEGRFLDCNQTLGSVYKLTDRSLLYLVTRPKDSMSIRVIAPNNRVDAKLDVKKFHTVNDIKMLVCSVLSLPSEGAKMIYMGTIMKGSKAIVSYDLEGDKFIQLVTMFPVLVQLPSGQTTEVNVYLSDDARRVVKRTLATLKMPLGEYDLFFKGAKLVDGKSISSYKVMEGSTLIMAYPQILTRGGSFSIPMICL